MTQRLTALEKVQDEVEVSARSAFRRRGENKNPDYFEGRAAGLNFASRIMQAELERLRNLWQNGALDYDSFGLPS